METCRVAYATSWSDLFHLAELGYVRKGKSGKELVFWWEGEMITPTFFIRGT